MMLPTVLLLGALLFTGPVTARVTEVVDGDSLRVDASIWLGVTITTLVRLRGIDAPELNGHCIEEWQLALRARAVLTELAGTDVTLHAISHDKYAGRVVATVTNGDGQDLSAVLVTARLARPYIGGTRQSWCEQN